MSAETCLRPRQYLSGGASAATLKPEAANGVHQTPTTNRSPCESTSDKDVQLSGPVWLAELGKPQTVCIYAMRKNSLDVGETVIGVAHRLKWKYGEREIALYYSPYSHYTEWLEICPIVNGRVQLTNVHAFDIKGRDHSRPLGVLPGSMLQQLMTENMALKKHA